MRRLVSIGLLLCSVPAAALAQQGSTPASGGDISKSDMGAHDSATMPSNLDMIRNGIRNNDMDRTARALRDKLGPAHPASTKELTSGATVNDKTGIAMATIVSVAADGVVLATVTGKVKIPADAFGRNNAGLLLDMTKGDFDKIVAKANASS
jgi:hypothetical protein